MTLPSGVAPISSSPDPAPKMTFEGEDPMAVPFSTSGVSSPFARLDRARENLRLMSPDSRGVASGAEGPQVDHEARALAPAKIQTLWARRGRRWERRERERAVRDEGVKTGAADGPRCSWCGWRATATRFSESRCDARRGREQHDRQNREDYDRQHYCRDQQRNPKFERVDTDLGME